MVSRRIAAGLVLIFVILAVLWLFNTVLENPIKTAGVVNNPDETGGIITKNIIEINESEFSPKELTISAGDIVILVNKDIKEHQFIFEKDTESDITKKILPGENQSFIFNEKGPWKYYDSINKNIFGEIIVE